MGGVASFRFGSKGSLPINVLHVIDLFIYKCRARWTRWLRSSSLRLFNSSGEEQIRCRHRAWENGIDGRVATLDREILVGGCLLHI